MGESVPHEASPLICHPKLENWYEFFDGISQLIFLGREGLVG
jgi:hypothetical protein